MAKLETRKQKVLALALVGMIVAASAMVVSGIVTGVPVPPQTPGPEPVVEGGSLLDGQSPPALPLEEKLQKADEAPVTFTSTPM
jgi:hypothetical protein